MKKKGPLILFLLLPVLLCHGTATAGSQTYYVTQNGSGNRNGSSYSDSWSWRDLFNSGNWSANETQTKIDPGDTVYLSGTFNVGSSTNSVPGSGSSVNYIVIDGDDGVHPPATINPTRAGDNYTVLINGKSYLEFVDITFATGGGAKAAFRGEGNASYAKIHDCYINRLMCLAWGPGPEATLGSRKSAIY